MIVQRGVGLRNESRMRTWSLGRRYLWIKGRLRLFEEGTIVLLVSCAFLCDLLIYINRHSCLYAHTYTRILTHHPVLTSSRNSYAPFGHLVSNPPDQLDAFMLHFFKKGGLSDFFLHGYAANSKGCLQGIGPEIFEYTSQNPKDVQDYQGHHKIKQRVAQIVANATAFHVLTDTGQVHSYGDPRFAEVLGRVVQMEDSE